MKKQKLPTVLLTGFTEFGEYGKNVSEVLMAEVEANLHLFPGATVVIRVLDVDYSTAEQQFDRAVLEVEPDLVISFGLSWSIDEIRLERFALNIDDASLPDNTGVLRQGSEIISGGTLALKTTLPLPEIYESLKNQNIPVKFSNHAGAFLCNHIFYHGLTKFSDTSPLIPYGFIHLPPLQTQVTDLGRTVLTQEQLLQAAVSIVNASLQSIGD